MKYLKYSIFIVFIILYSIDVFLITPYAFMTLDNIVEEGAVPNAFYQTFGISGFYISGAMIVLLFIMVFYFIRKIDKLPEIIFSMLIGMMIMTLRNNFKVLGWI